MISDRFIQFPDFQIFHMDPFRDYKIYTKNSIFNFKILIACFCCLVFVLFTVFHKTYIGIMQMVLLYKRHCRLLYKQFVHISSFSKVIYVHLFARTKKFLYEYFMHSKKGKTKSFCCKRFLNIAINVCIE